VRTPAQRSTLKGPGGFLALPRSIDRFLEQTYGLDLRSLALFRIGLGALIVGDLTWRARDVPASFTLLVLLGMGFGAMLLVGYRTRLAAIASWLLLIALHNGDAVILHGGDILLRTLAFWAMFLPLNAHRSLDRALDNSNAGYPQRVFTAASVAFMAQVAFPYGAVWWRDGSGIMGVLALTLLFSPVMAGPARTAAVLLMAALPLTLLPCMHLGHFPLVAAVAALGLLPTWAWSRGERDAGPALTIYYDGNCEFCRKMVLILKTFLLSPRTAVLPAQDDPQARAEMTREHSWVVADLGGGHHFRTAAMAVCLRPSILRPLAWVLDRRPVKGAADRLYHWVAGHRSLLTRLLSPLRYRPLELRTHRLANVVALFFLGYLCWWNLGTVNHRLSMPDRYRWIAIATHTDQRWDVFASHRCR
jgi:predicted DCC family thiol-disulfide oxidoreductase YuxK